MFLTEKQLVLPNFIRDFIEDRGISPTLDEMSQYFGVSKITVYEHVNALEKKGAITKTPNMARSITLVEHKPARAAARPSGLSVKGRIAAGAAIEAIETDDVFTFDALAPDDTENYMLRVEGESMIEAHICPGDLVVVAPAKTAKNGEIVVAMLPDETTGGLKATLKTFYKEKGRIRLQPANASMKPIYVKDVEIAGKVVGVVRPRL